MTGIPVLFIPGNAGSYKQGKIIQGLFSISPGANNRPQSQSKISSFSKKFPNLKLKIIFYQGGTSIEK